MEQISDARALRGMEIAENGGIQQVDLNLYKVPAQWGSGCYTVNFGEQTPTCDCPDCQTRHVKCKHQWAVEYFLKWQRDEKGNVTVTQVKRITYPQDWKSYTTAQTREVELFDRLLKDLVQNVEEEEYVFGRPKLNLRETTYCAIQKVYSGLSSRRARSLYKNAEKKEAIRKAPNYNAVNKLLNREDVKPILQELLKLSSLPLKSVERDFAIDSSGFRTTQFNEYCKEKHKTGKKHKWLKAHVMSGTKTNVITSASITRDYHHDTNEFKPLVQSTYDNGFKISEVSADKAYSSKSNLGLVDELGGTPYIPFKENVRGTRTRGGSPIWTRMYHLFQYKNDEFMTHYHKRSNAETVFHMVKMKFGDKVRSKNRVAQENELLCKFIAHNIVVLIHEMFELGIEPVFCS